jgi:DNA (cytosine-5)-methyltransferase 1
MKKIKFIDLFSGCGGLSEAFLKSNKYSPIKIIDNDKFCYETTINRIKKLKFKNPEKIAELKDISSLDTINKFKNIRSDIVIGGPPCQAYSVAGRIRDKHGMKKDYRNYLFESFLKIINYSQPNYFIMENVPGMLSAKPGNIKVTVRIKKQTDKIKYYIPENLSECVFDLSKYEVPQKRKRVIIFGVNKKLKNFKSISKKFYEILRSLESKKIVTVKEAIGDLGKLYPLKNITKTNGRKFSHKINSKKADHSPRFHNERDIKIFKLLTEDIETKKFKYKTVKDLQKLYTKIVGKKSNIHKYYVLRKDEPSNLIPSHLYKDGLRHIHYDSKQARSITVREAARLQSFPDNFEFIGPMTQQYKMIGNAVPPNFSKFLMKAILKLS